MINDYDALDGCEELDSDGYPLVQPELTLSGAREYPGRKYYDYESVLRAIDEYCF